TEGRVAAALAEMSAHTPADFPPLWDPPPRLAYAQWKPLLLEVFEAMAENPPAAWVQALYFQKLREHLESLSALGTREDDETIQRFAEILRQLPEGPAFLEELPREPLSSGVETLLRYSQMPSRGDGP